MWSALLLLMASVETGATPDQTPVRHALPPDQHSPARLERNPTGFWYALEDHHYFSPPLADVNAPVFYMRLYRAAPVRFTQDAPGFDPGGSHLFWDVGFGGEFPLLGHDNADRRDLPRFPNTLPAGWAIFVDGDAHMLLDFSAASSAVIDTEFRFGGGVMGRGIPWFTSRFDHLSHLCWKVKYFHESTHLGDEYQKAALANGDFRRVNVSFEALEAFLAVDRFSQTGFFRYLRAYAGYRRLFDGPYDLDPASRVTSAGARDEGQLGFDIRRELLGPLPYLCNHFLGRVLCPDAGILGADLLMRRQFDFDGSNTSPRWLTVHAVVGFEWGEILTDELVFRVAVDGHLGLNPHGQFQEEPLKYLGLTLQMTH